ncbi:hypothetical protein SAMN05428964_102341 [Thalassospira xiamenensis]|uniref:Uncharacterized protein n=1 Tax=Thalassospira xiamenensis TaxID=220697 RepID=A0A285T6V3_9PROT|nr:hypothetical protein SAMN05428964_102341 [Thalassospira xiamenensis]
MADTEIIPAISINQPRARHNGAPFCVERQKNQASPPASKSFTKRLRTPRRPRRQCQDRHASLLKPGNRGDFPANRPNALLEQKQASNSPTNKRLIDGPMPSLLPLPANPPQRLPAMQNFRQYWTNLGLPPAPPTVGPLTAHGLAACSGSSGHAMTTEARTNLGLPPAAPPDDPMTTHTSLPAPATSGNGMTTEPGQTSGLQQPRQLTPHGPLGGSLPAPTTATTCHPDVQTHLGPPPSSPADDPGACCPLRALSGHGDNLPPRRPDTSRATAIFTGRRISGVLPPTCPPPTGHKSLPPLLPLLPLPANPGSLPRQDAPLPS